MSARVGIVSLTLLVLCAGFLLQAQPAAQSPSASVTILGTSTIRGWSCPAEGAIEVTAGGSSAPVPGLATGVQAVKLTVPVAAIECPEEEMIEHLRDAMAAEEYPEIVYELEEYTLTGDTTAETSGTITIYGVTNPIAFEVSLEPSPQGVRSVGETEIDMREFSITPPTLWLGLLKVGPMVRVRFDTMLQP